MIFSCFHRAACLAVAFALLAAMAPAQTTETLQQTDESTAAAAAVAAPTDEAPAPEPSPTPEPEPIPEPEPAFVTQAAGEETAAPETQTADAASSPTKPATAPAATEAQPEPTAAEEFTTVTLPSGLEYRDLKIGDGDKPTTAQARLVHYTLRLADGTVADSSRDRLLPNPLNFTPGANQVIAGFEEGAKEMRVGGRRLVVIPPAMGYGDRGTARIPPNSTLYFDVELVAIK